VRASLLFFCRCNLHFATFLENLQGNFPGTFLENFQESFPENFLGTFPENFLETFTATFLENLQQQPSQETFSCKLSGNLHSKVSENLWQTLWKPSQQSFRKPSANFRKSSATFPETFCRNPS